MDGVQNVKYKLKINNSYESEPSSGSGSSLGEHNEYHASDEENMQLPYLLKPKAENLAQVSNDDGAHPLRQLKSRGTAQQSPQESLPSSNERESPFNGFGDSPYGNVNKRLYGSQHDKLKLPVTLKACAKRPSPGQLIFPKFYDTIVEENSCNAMDLQLSTSSKTDTQHNATANVSMATPNTTTSNVVELTFNGKIKSLTAQNIIDTKSTAKTSPAPAAQPAQVLETSFNAAQLTDNSMLRKYNNERSPDIFADSESDMDEEDVATETVQPTVNVATTSKSDDTGRDDKSAPNASTTYKVEYSFIDEQTLDGTLTMPGGAGDDAFRLFRENCQRERELLRRVRSSLGGVRPPPSVTIPQLDLCTTVVNLKDDVLNFLNKPSTSTSSSNSSSQKPTCLFKPTHTLSETLTMPWRDILGVRQHGLSYNLNKAAEHNEYLSLSVIERYIGAETATSYVNSPSSAKKRNTRLKHLMQSPGNRLSHLAKRRAVFSSANLATNSLKFNSSIGPQIVIDKRKARNKRKATPKRMTPTSKKKYRETPTSSKRLFRCDLIKPGPSRETSKRALFQSPAKSLQKKPLPPPKPLIKPEIANRVEKSKRALFSPDNQNRSTVTSSNYMGKSTSTICASFAADTKLETLLKRKRNHAEEQDAAELTSQSSKLFRSSNESLTPRALKIKSQSFCAGAGSSLTSLTTAAVGIAPTFSTATTATATSVGAATAAAAAYVPGQVRIGGAKFQRAYSEMAAPPNSLTENQRKKLLWAVSVALQDKKIAAKHPSFKQHASVLARVVKRVFQEFYQKNATSNSETMLRLAKKYVYQVISGQSSDDIYLLAKTQLDECKRQSSTRLSGYICAEEYAQLKLSHTHTQQSQQTQKLSQLNISGSLQNIFSSENSIDSFGLSQFSQTSSAAVYTSQTNVFEDACQTQCSGGSSTQSSASKQQLPIQYNAALQNSSSKSNLGGLALRENVDCEQRRSAQKNFTGKDQRNVSPYTNSSNSNNAGSARKIQSVFSELSGGSGAKAKRQISFDS